jgi:hypothetical protein
MLITQLLNAQRLADEAASKLKKKEEEMRFAHEELKLDYNRLIEDVATATQDQGNKIVEKIESLRMYLNVFEKEKVDQSIYEDFMKEIEMLSNRIFVLEKRLVEQKADKNQTGGSAKTNESYDKVIEKINQYIDHLKSLSQKQNDIVSIRNLVEGLQTMLNKEAGLEKIVEEIHGFMDYFNDQWNKFNIAMLEQNATISK